MGKPMKKIIKWILVIIGSFILICLVIIGIISVKFNPWGVGVGMAAHRAETCQECHPLIYKEWRDGMIAAFAAMKEPFLETREEEAAGFLCWKCHDPFKLGIDEGVTCEYCHGIDGTPEEDGHEVYEKSLEALRNEKFCHQCHAVHQPFSGVDLHGTVGEWEQSKARKQGLTCQHCHMPVIGEGEDKHHFHGHYYPGRNPLPDRGNVIIKDIYKENGQINVIVLNPLISHSLPTGGNFNAMFLKVKGFDENSSKPIFEDQYVFIKRFEFKKALGIKEMPYTVSLNTRIKSEEERKITFTPDKSVRIRKIRATIRSAFVGDFGFEPLHYTSDFLAKKEIVLKDK